MSNQAESQAALCRRVVREMIIKEQSGEYVLPYCYANNTTVSVVPLFRHTFSTVRIPREKLATYKWGECNVQSLIRSNSVNFENKIHPLVNELAKEIQKTSNIKWPIKSARSALEATYEFMWLDYAALVSAEEIQVAKRRYQAEIRMVKRVFPMQDRDCLGLICEYAYGELGSAIHDPEMPAGVYTGRRLKIKVPASMKHTGAINMCNDIVNSIVDNL